MGSVTQKKVFTQNDCNILYSCLKTDKDGVLKTQLTKKCLLEKYKNDPSKKRMILDAFVEVQKIHSETLQRVFLQKVASCS